ncbi:MAG TPA: response regulator transcription factor [Acidimicrobiia bacterium]|jgi:DNA-binding NarL/FixJ family response regulator|nr:response regulator transcription factor [Acidimicrobiia bacterium]
MSDRPIRVFVVEDEPLTRAGVRHHLDDRCEIVGEADNVTDAVAMIRERQPDVVLLDVHIREGKGWTVVDEVKSTHPRIKFLALTVSTSRSDVLRLVRAGVDGYVTKHSVGPDFVRTVENTVAGGRPISRQVAAHLLDLDDVVEAADHLDRLTLREREVAVLIARGYTYREAAAELNISVKTLESHIGHIFGKLNITSRHALAALAYETGFVESSHEALPEHG